MLVEQIVMRNCHCSLDDVIRSVDSADAVSLQWGRHRLELNQRCILISLFGRATAMRFMIAAEFQFGSSADRSLKSAAIRICDFSDSGFDKYRMEAPYTFHLGDQRTEQVIVSALHRIQSAKIFRLLFVLDSKDHLRDLFDAICQEHQCAFSDLHFEHLKSPSHCCDIF